MHTPEQIETWAREAGVLNFTTQRAGVFARFAALVAQHEMERAAKVVEEMSGRGWSNMATNVAAAIRNSDGG